jgi:hypothetical protein
MAISSTIVSCLALVAAAQFASAQGGPKITVPHYNDKYSRFVKELEAGHTNINYTEFRDSFLDSEQFKIAAQETTELANLRRKMHDLMRQSKSREILEVTSKMLSIDYTDMEAHKILRQTCKIVGDAANEKKHHDIEFGLLKSIVGKGDGNTCQTAWPVIQVEEEYFVLAMRGARVLRQSIDNTGGLCDKMEVETDEGKRTYYFDVNKVFRGYNKRGLH